MLALRIPRSRVSISRVTAGGSDGSAEVSGASSGTLPAEGLPALISPPPPAGAVSPPPESAMGNMMHSASTTSSPPPETPAITGLALQ